ncbi:MAG TPA: hypothetical protein VHH36_01440 [Candidatus Thermoplasmatota archaeon]|nr:hypothetical protein [Candidatus Thermoplasmatota archaeon]
MRGTLVWVLLALLAAPIGAAGDDLLVDGACAPATVAFSAATPVPAGSGARCVPLRACTYDHTAGFYEGPGFCQATTCSPATECHATLRSNDSCRTNASIDARTCALSRVATLAVRGVGAGVGDTRVVVSGAAVTGHTRGRDVPHDWAQAGADADAKVAGQTLGTARASAYASRLNVTSTGQQEHNATRAAAHAQADGPVGATADGALLLLDERLQSCSASGSVRGVPSEAPPGVPRGAGRACRDLPVLP